MWPWNAVVAATHRIVHQMKPVVEVVDKREGVGDIVTLWAEEEQHSQLQVFCTTEHSIQTTESNTHKHTLTCISVNKQRKCVHAVNINDTGCCRTHVGLCVVPISLLQLSLPLSLYLSVYSPLVIPPPGMWRRGSALVSVSPGKAGTRSISLQPSSFNASALPFSRDGVARYLKGVLTHTHSCQRGWWEMNSNGDDMTEVIGELPLQL